MDIQVDVRPTTTIRSAVSPTQTLNSRPHVAFLDGVRGLAALYVVLSHLAVVTGLPRWAAALTRWTYYGHAAVAVFIVLSGFCLMLPVTQSAEGQLQGGWRAYLLRRARRILPPYYAALVLSLPIYYLHQHSHRWAFDSGALISHLFLLHNLSPRWNEALDGPMWSVATEWQIYFFLPFVLLPIWRKFGMASTALCAFAIGLLPHFLLPPEHNFDWACPWYLGLFGLGMWGAELSYGKHWREGRRVPGAAIWNSACIVLMMGVVGAYMLLRDNWTPYSIFIDPFIGLAAMCLIVGCARASQDNSRRKYERAALSLFETRFAQWIGSFSYSLYLTHSLVFYSVGWLLDKALRLPTHIAVARYCALLPIMLAFGYVFYLLFERPTMRKKSVQTPDSISAPRA